jgi:hypothetical protein
VGCPLSRVSDRLSWSDAFLAVSIFSHLVIRSR